MTNCAFINVASGRRIDDNGASTTAVTLFGSFHFYGQAVHRSGSDGDKLDFKSKSIRTSIECVEVRCAESSSDVQLPPDFMR